MCPYNDLIDCTITKAECDGTYSTCQTHKNVLSPMQVVIEMNAIYQIYVNGKRHMLVRTEKVAIELCDVMNKRNMDLKPLRDQGQETSTGLRTDKRVWTWNGAHIWNDVETIIKECPLNTEPLP